MIVWWVCTIPPVHDLLQRFSGWQLTLMVLMLPFALLVVGMLWQMVRHGKGPVGGNLIVAAILIGIVVLGFVTAAKAGPPL